MSSLRQKQNTIRKRFTKEEDDRLRNLVKQMGTGSWKLISQYMPHRCGRQCRERYYNYLVMNFQKGDWRPEEDEMIIQKYREIGPKWVEISEFLKDRSANNIKNRWHKVLSKRDSQFPDEEELLQDSKMDDSRPSINLIKEMGIDESDESKLISFISGSVSWNLYTPTGY